MNKLVVLPIAFLLPALSFGQAQTSRLPFNETGISANYTFAVSPDYEVQNGLGGGLMLYRSWREGKKVNPVSGLDYNFTNFKTHEVFDHMGYFYSDLRFRYHQVRLPFSVRFNMGRTTNFFIEPGICLSVTGGTYSGPEVNVSSGETQQIRKGTGVRGDLATMFGLGIQTPLKAGYLIIKADVSKGLGRTYLATGNPSESMFFYNSYIRLSVIYRRKLM